MINQEPIMSNVQRLDAGGDVAGHLCEVEIRAVHSGGGAGAQGAGVDASTIWKRT